MIDYDADAEMIGELMEIAGRPSGPAQTTALEDLLAEADAGGLVHSAIFVRSLLAGSLGMADADDLAPILGLLAESQQLLRDHQAELIAEVFEPILIQTHMTLLLLLESPAVPLARVEALRANYEQMCRQVGMTLRGAYAVAMIIAVRREDHAAAEQLFVRSQAQPRHRVVIMDSVENAVEWYARRGRYDEAFRLYEQATPESEGDYYRYVQIALLVAAQSIGRTELAARLHSDSFDPDDIDSGDAPRLTYLALAGRYDEGLALLPLVMKPQDYDTDRSRAICAEHAAVLLGHLQAAGRGGEQVAGMGATVSDLAGRYRDLAERTARRVDEVNKLDVAVRRLHAFWTAHGPSRGAGRQALSPSAPPTAPPR